MVVYAERRRYKGFGGSGIAACSESLRGPRSRGRQRQPVAATSAHARRSPPKRQSARLLWTWMGWPFAGPHRPSGDGYRAAWREDEGSPPLVGGGGKKQIGGASGNHTSGTGGGCHNPCVTAKGFRRAAPAVDNLSATRLCSASLFWSCFAASVSGRNACNSAADTDDAAAATAIAGGVDHN